MSRFLAYSYQHFEIVLVAYIFQCCNIDEDIFQGKVHFSLPNYTWILILNIEQNLYISTRPSDHAVCQIASVLLIVSPDNFILAMV